MERPDPESPQAHRRAWARSVHALLGAAGASPELALLGTAQAAVESGWGRQRLGNNLWGIKPVADQPFVLGRPELREFPTLFAAAKAWLYLPRVSSLYRSAREKLNHALVHAPTPEHALAAWRAFYADFAALYCPTNPAYPDLVLRVADEIASWLSQATGAPASDPPQVGYPSKDHPSAVEPTPGPETADRAVSPPASGLQSPVSSRAPVASMPCGTISTKGATPMSLITGKTFTTKTFWGGVASIASGVGLIVTGEVVGGLQLIGTGIIAIFLRDAVTKTGQ